MKPHHHLIIALTITIETSNRTIERDRTQALQFCPREIITISIINADTAESSLARGLVAPRARWGMLSLDEWVSSLKQASISGEPAVSTSALISAVGGVTKNNQGAGRSFCLTWSGRGVRNLVWPGRVGAFVLPGVGSELLVGPCLTFRDRWKQFLRTSPSCQLPCRARFRQA